MSVLVNCLGQRDPALMSDDDCRDRRIVGRFNKRERARVQQAPLHPYLTDPHAYAAMWDRHDADLDKEAA